MRSKSLCVAAFGLLAFALACGESGAQGYPLKPIRLVVGYSPGGGTDLTARTVAPKLSERLGQPVIVENKPGANATIGVGYVAKADPDGYTLLVGTSAEMHQRQVARSGRSRMNRERSPGL